MKRFLLPLALALTAACEPRPAEQVPVDQAMPDSALESTAPVQPAPAPAPLPTGAAAAAPVEAAPSRADSLAGAARDVSPEWIERGRTMAGYGRCMEQAKDLPPEARARAEAGCAQRPGAPR